MPVSSDTPHGLELVIDFVNTWDAEEGVEELQRPEQLAQWLDERALLRPPAPRVDARALARARSLRESLRSVLLEHNGVPGDGSAAAELQAAAERGRLSVRFAGADTVDIVAAAPGVDGALAALLVPVARGAADGSWARVKACAAGDCQWAFYDRSRNRSGRWCDMAECGNRAKVRAYRGRGGGRAAE